MSDYITNHMKQRIPKESGELPVIFTDSDHHHSLDTDIVVPATNRPSISFRDQLWFTLKGPMGKGLRVERTGVHIAFTAGTGSLLFLDLVAHLIRKNLKMLNNQEDEKLDKHSFKFVFYMSFQGREESCGLKLCEGLRDICKKYKIDNFVLNIRLSELKH